MSNKALMGMKKMILKAVSFGYKNKFWYAKHEDNRWRCYNCACWKILAAGVAYILLEKFLFFTKNITPTRHNYTLFDIRSCRKNGKFQMKANVSNFLNCVVISMKQ